MKNLKYLVVGFITVTLIVILAINFNLSYQEPGIEGGDFIYLDNIHALAQGEGGGGGCAIEGRVPCDDTLAKYSVSR